MNQSIDSDYSFNIGNGPDAGDVNYVNPMLRLPDGDLLVGGEWQQWDHQDMPNFVRLNSDGSIEELFDAGTGPNGPVRDIVSLPSGQILLAGTFTEYNGIPCPYICRIWPDGTLDTNFNLGNQLEPIDAPRYTYISVIKALDNGEILVGGRFQYTNNASRTNLARLGINGAMVPDLEPDTDFDYVEAILPLNDNAMLVGGTNGPVLTRLDKNGQEMVNFTADINSGSIYTIESMTLNGLTYILLGGEYDHVKTGWTYFDSYILSSNSIYPRGNATPIRVNNWVGNIITFPEGVVYLAGRFAAATPNSNDFDNSYAKCARLAFTNTSTAPDEATRLETPDLFYLDPKPYHILETQSPVHIGIHRTGAKEEFEVLNMAGIDFSNANSLEHAFKPGQSYRIAALDNTSRSLSKSDQQYQIQIQNNNPGSEIYGGTYFDINFKNVDQQLDDWLFESLTAYSDTPADWDAEADFGNDGVGNQLKAMMGWVPGYSYEVNKPRFRIQEIDGVRYPIYSFYYRADLESPMDLVVKFSENEDNFSFQDQIIPKNDFDEEQRVTSGWHQIKGAPIEPGSKGFFQVGLE